MDRTDKTRYETVYLRDEISRCEDVFELKERILPMLKTQQDQWKDKINALIGESGLTKTRLAEMIGVSRMAVNKWCNGAIPKNRETFLRIGMAAGYNREKMDQLLMRYGRYPNPVTSWEIGILNAGLDLYLIAKMVSMPCF